MKKNRQPSPALRKARRALGMTQTQLARAAGVTQGQVCAIELGVFGCSADTAAALAAVLNKRAKRRVITEMQILYPGRRV